MPIVPSGECRDNNNSGLNSPEAYRSDCGDAQRAFRTHPDATDIQRVERHRTDAATTAHERPVLAQIKNNLF